LGNSFSCPPHLFGNTSLEVEPIDNEPTQERIHIISRGETIAKDSLLTRRAYARQALHVDSVAHVENDEEPITFTPMDQGDILMPHDDPLVMSTMIAKHPIKRILVDSGNSINLIYWDCFEQCT